MYDSWFTVLVHRCATQPAQSLSLHPGHNHFLIIHWIVCQTQYTPINEIINVIK